MNEKEKSLAGLLYQPGESELTAEREITVQKLYEFNQLHPLDRAAKKQAIRQIFGNSGENCTVEQPFFCTYGSNISVGDNFFLNVNCRLMDSGKITIGHNVMIAPNVSLITEEHAMDVKQRLEGLEYTRPITIQDNVWLATGVLVLPGVTIGENSVIGAGSVVTKDIPANCLAVGNPCRVVKPINNEQKQST
ncbi:sugar O-acetyltransferase [Enterococcus sp. LJL98]